jgi:hypothetical protein
VSPPSAIFGELPKELFHKYQYFNIPAGTDYNDASHPVSNAALSSSIRMRVRPVGLYANGSPSLPSRAAHQQDWVRTGLCMLMLHLYHQAAEPLD